MKKMISYQQFINERKLNLESNQVNEEIFGWLKKKASEWLQSMRDINSGRTTNEDDNRELLQKNLQLLPDEVIEVIKKEVEKTLSREAKNESVNLIIEAMFDALLGNMPSDEEVKKMSAEEFDEYLCQLAKDKYFKFYVDEDDPHNWKKGYTEHSDFQDFLRERGIDINQYLIPVMKPSLDNINKKIDNLNISDGAKKVIKVAAIVVFTILLSSKAYSGTIGHGHSDYKSDLKGGYKLVGDDDKSLKHIGDGDGDKKISKKQSDYEKWIDTGAKGGSSEKSHFTTTDGSEKVNLMFNQQYLPKLLGTKTIAEAAKGLTAKQFVDKLKLAYEDTKTLNDPQNGVLKFFKDKGIKPGNKDVEQFQKDLSNVKGFEEFKNALDKSEKFDDGNFGVATAKGAIKRWIDNFSTLDPDYDVSKMFKNIEKIDKILKPSNVKEKPKIAGKTMDIDVGQQTLK